MRLFLTQFLVLGLVTGVFAGKTPDKRIATAVRTNASIKIDGIIDEAAWNAVVPAADFTQLEPVPNTAPSMPTEVRVLYDDSGIYIGAIMYDDPNLILKELSQRDNRGNTDWFAVSFDTYRDGLNGFAFIVTAAGVQQDQRFSASGDDYSWDGIWDSSVAFLENGWSVEMYIPYLSLRFPAKEVQEWNVQFGREIRRLRETSFWNPIDPNIDGFINQAGHLDGIKNIESPIRLSLTPFVTGYVNSVINDADPANNETSMAYTGGMDLKYGINDAFTLDMTLIPDFGQVLSDNQVLNLTPFEVYFEENRQFFTEGLELFNKGNLFYTRRVGSRPLNYSRAFTERKSSELVLNNPGTSQLINATKISGRMSSGTGLGFFNGVVDESFATLVDTLTGVQRAIQTNPLTNYNVLVADQNLANNSVVTFLNTNVYRRGDDYNANTTGAFFLLRSEDQNFVLEGKGVLSRQFYTESTTNGHSYSLYGGKVGGKYRAAVGFNIESDDYDINDMGFLLSPNEKSAYGEFSIVEFTPRMESLQRWEVSIEPFYSRLYNPDVFVDFGLNWRTFVLWKSRNAIGLNGRFEPFETYDYFEPRTSDFSRFYAFPKNWSVGGFFSSDYRKMFAIDLRFSYREFDEPGRKTLNFSVEPRFRANNKMSFFPGLSVTVADREVGYVNAGLSPTASQEVGNDGIMFGVRDRLIIENSLNGQFIFTNNMFLTFRVRHYWDNVKYQRFTLLEQDGSLTNLDYNGIDEGELTYDASINFFNVDLNYTWRFARGSDLIFNWKNSIFQNNRDLDEGYISNLNGLFNARQTNSISIRLIYFLDYSTIFGN